MLKTNGALYGALLGLVLPGITLFVSMILNPDMRVLGKENVYYILCVAANLLIARLLFKKNKDNAAYGVLASTFFCAFLFLLTHRP